MTSKRFQKTAFPNISYIEKESSRDMGAKCLKRKGKVRFLKVF